MLHSTSRRGFTLVELLVVIAIIGILVGLLLPAVQAAREAARRMQCSNNLKQLALATHNYHDTMRAFPVGSARMTAGDGTILVNEPSWAWGAMVLPFMEQGSLYDALGVSSRPMAAVFVDTTTVPTGLQLLQTPLAMFQCPSDNGTDLNVDRAFTTVANAPQGGYQISKSNYPGNGGDWADTGVFADNKKVTIGSITDGLSNTILIGERASLAPSQASQPFAALWAGRAGDNDLDISEVQSYRGLTLFRMNSGESETGAPSAEQAYGSNHPGGAQFALCDGSVRFISETIDWTKYVNDPAYPGIPLGTFNTLAHISDGHVVADY